ncbi:vacuolar sorting-associated protein Vps27 [Schizophyllum commune]
MSLSSWLWGSSQLDDAIEKATSELLPAGSEDIALNLEICDQIRSKAVPAKDAMKSLKARLNHKNPNVQLLALGLTDVCVKNGGDHFLAEVASREFMDNLVSILKMPTLNNDVKTAILRYIQNWAIAFEGKAALSYVGTIYKQLQNEGFAFPPKDPALATTAMVDTQTAPEWIDSDVCLRCRTPFTFTNRKHHCRNCGQVFDQQCSSKTMALPHFGIAQEVRVCDGCYNKLRKRGDKTHRHSQSLHAHRSRAAQDIADAELQRAIQLSLEEVGAAGARRPGYVPAQPSQPSGWSEPPIVDRASRPSAAYADDDDPDLRAAIEASLREANAPKPSAPIAMESPSQPVFEDRAGPGFSQSYPSSSHLSSAPLPHIPNYDLEPLEEDAILTFSQTVEAVHAQGGRDMARYPAVGELYNKAVGLRPKLAMGLEDAGRKEEVLTEMHDKLSQAVKLYDQLLTQRVAQPQWRQSTYAQPPPQQGYSQQQPAYQQQTTYAPPQQQQAYQPQQYSQWQQPQQVSAPVQQESTSYMAQATSSPPVAFQPLASQAAYQPPQSPISAQPSAYQQSFAATPAPPSIPHVTYSPRFAADGASTPTPGIEQQQQNPTPTAPPPVSSSPVQGQPVRRSQTVSVATQPAQANVQRSGTYAARSPSVQQSYQAPPRASYQTPSGALPQGYQSPVYQAPPPPSVNPMAFPVAPTSTPQSFPMYGPSVPQGIVEEPRKEAALIEL